MERTIITQSAMWDAAVMADVHVARVRAYLFGRRPDASISPRWEAVF